MPARARYRVGFLVLVVLLAALPVHSYVTAPPGNDGSTMDAHVQDLPATRGNADAALNTVTVITNNQGPLIAIAQNGSVVYRNDTYQDYWDVDPSPAGEMTVLYSATDDYDAAECPVDTPCSLNVVERVNLTTGDVERLFSQYYPGKFDNEWHDVDRLNETHLVVADMARNQVVIVDTTTGIIDWAWDAQNHLSITTGGEQAELDPQGWPDDWTHLNDVEALDDGRIMASLRNQDQVVFIDRRDGVVGEWTLGAEADHAILFEQHNPDYIPEVDGGPAVVIADSQNNRLVEYQRVDGDWERTWSWTDAEMLWPRDADRLPNGYTLVTDTNSERVFEVDADGEIVWRVDLPARWRPYEAERLGTGDESAGGPSASRATLRSRGDATALDDPINPKYDGSTARSIDERITGHLLRITKLLVPNKLLNAVVFVLPAGLGAGDVLPLGLLGVTLLGWGILELYLYQRSVTIELRLPIRIGK